MRTWHYTTTASFLLDGRCTLCTVKSCKHSKKHTQTNCFPLFQICEAFYMSSFLRVCVCVRWGYELMCSKKFFDHSSSQKFRYFQATQTRSEHAKHGCRCGESDNAHVKWMEKYPHTILSMDLLSIITLRIGLILSCFCHWIVVKSLVVFVEFQKKTKICGEWVSFYTKRVVQKPHHVHNSYNHCINQAAEIIVLNCHHWL